MNLKIHYCTLFDIRYAPRALVMLESLARHAKSDFDVTILAMDDKVPAFICKLGDPQWRVLSFTDLNDEAFVALESRRPHREFCWTAAPVLCNSMLKAAADGELIVYLDADLMFFDDPGVLLDELGSDKTILIHEHRYSPGRTQWAATSGRFNVGFVAFRAVYEARMCAARWRDQVIDICVLDPDKGLCGDQAYLNEWPDLYSGLRIMDNIGGGVAPWNLDAYLLGGTRDRPTVDGKTVVFFHYHAFKIGNVRFMGPAVFEPARGYFFISETTNLFVLAFSITSNLDFRFLITERDFSSRETAGSFFCISNFALAKFFLAEEIK